MVRFLSRLRPSGPPSPKKSNICCSVSEVGSDCSSLCQQEAADVLQLRLLPAPTRALDEWTFPSSRSGLRNGSSSSSRLFRFHVAHGATFPVDGALLSPGGSASRGDDSPSPRKEQQRCLCSSRAVSGVACCCCSDTSTHSGGSAELYHRMRWGCNSVCRFGGVQQQQQLQQQQQQSLLGQPPQALGLLLNVPTLIETRGLKCLILDAPTNENLQAYVAEMHNVGVTDLVRTCASTYDDSQVEASGIRVHELTFLDGEAPPVEVIAKWRALVARVTADGGVVAVHCVAGLGRGPVLVALSLIDRGFDPEEAVHFIRARRKGAINRRQLMFLHSYRRHAVASRRCMKSCTIM